MIKASAEGVNHAVEVLSRYRNLITRRHREMFQLLGDIAKRQTEFRVGTSKSDPDGVTWKPWSRSYASTRESFHSLLISSKELFRSFKVIASAREGEMGTDISYSRYVQDKRQFIGVGSDDLNEMEEVLNRWIKDQAGEF